MLLINLPEHTYSLYVANSTICQFPIICRAGRPTRPAKDKRCPLNVDSSQPNSWDFVTFGPILMRRASVFHVNFAVGRTTSQISTGGRGTFLNTRILYRGTLEHSCPASDDVTSMSCPPLNVIHRYDRTFDRRRTRNVTRNKNRKQHIPHFTTTVLCEL
jgi:hypothetical protein